MFCRNCGQELDNSAMFCPECGAKQVDSTTETVFCKHCASEIDADCVICPKCGKQVKEIEMSSPSIVINNENINTNTNTVAGIPGKMCKKWVAFFLCLFVGFLGAHKFYEGKIGMGILYFFTGGLFIFGWVIDTIAILFKPDPYYVY